MSVIDLTNRLTEDIKRFRLTLKSDDSLIYVSPFVSTDESEPGTLDLCIGDQIYDTARQQAFSIPDEGLEMKPGRCFVVQTRQQLMCPHNVVGILSGKGSLIFRGLFVSQGKIDPGYNGPLKVGLLNAGRTSYFLKKGDPLCSCLFFSLDSHIDLVAPQPLVPPVPIAAIGFLTRLKLQGFDWWIKVLGLLAAYTAAVATILRYFKS